MQLLTFNIPNHEVWIQKTLDKEENRSKNKRKASYPP